MVNLSLTSVAVPHQHCLNLNPCLGKPSGDRQTICKSPMMHRMTMRVDREIRGWKLDDLEDYDTARTGSSALHAALVRNLRAEVANWLGEHLAAVLTYLHKFLDSVHILTPITNALKEGCPPVKFAYLLQQHLSPRAVQANGFTAIS